MKTHHVIIEGGQIRETVRDGVPVGCPGNPAKRAYARHDRGPPLYETNAYDAVPILSNAEQDEDVAYQLIPKPLGDVKAWAKAKLTADAETAGARFVTPGPLKAAEYALADDEALRYVIEKGQGAYLILQAKVSAGEFPDVATAAQVIAQRSAATRRALAAIVEVRTAAKLRIEAANSVEEVLSALKVTWPETA